MKENFVRADGVSYREAVEKCIRHYVMRGYSINDETKRFTNDPIDEVFRVYLRTSFSSAQSMLCSPAVCSNS